MAVKRLAVLVLCSVLWSCGDESGKDDKAKQAVREVITREFDYYKGAKERLGQSQKQEQQRREQEKELQ